MPDRPQTVGVLASAIVSGGERVRREAHRRQYLPAGDDPARSAVITPLPPAAVIKPGVDRDCDAAEYDGDEHLAKRVEV